MCESIEGLVPDSVRPVCDSVVAHIFISCIVGILKKLIPVFRQDQFTLMSKIMVLKVVRISILVPVSRSSGIQATFDEIIMGILEEKACLGGLGFGLPVFMATLFGRVHKLFEPERVEVRERELILVDRCTVAIAMVASPH